MNWTGGRLSRHSRRADSSTISKQKQYFAKMRNHLMSGSGKWSPAGRPDFDMIASQAKDSNPVRDRTFRTKLAPSSRDLRPGRSLFFENELSGDIKHNHLTQSNFNTPISAAGQIPDYYEKGPKPIHTIDAVGTADRLQKNAESIRRKRINILRDGDWLGLSIQRPLQLKYPQQESRDVIGKRRKLNTGYEPRYTAVQDNIASPFESNCHIRKRNKPVEYGNAQRHSTQYGHPPSTNGSARIFINGREINVRPHVGTAPSSSSSDIMLLDSEGGRRRPRQAYKRSSDITHSGGLDRRRFGSEGKSTSSFDCYPSSGPQIQKIQERNGSIYSPSVYQERPWRSHETNRPSHAMDHNVFSIGESPHSDAIFTPSARPEFRWPRDPNATYKHISAGKLEGVAAQPLIYHPAPRSSTTARILRSDSLEFDSSVAATAGENVGESASAARDEEMWKTWLVSESNSGQTPDSPVNSQRQQASNSSRTDREVARRGSSMLSYFDQSGFEDGPEDQTKEAAFSIPNLDSRVSASHNAEGFGNNDDFSGVRDTTLDSHMIKKENIELPIIPQKRNRQDANGGPAWEAAILPEPRESRPGPAVKGRILAPKEDPDAAWKKFVLSTDSEYDNPAFDGFRTNADFDSDDSRNRMQLSSSKTSLQVHPEGTVIHSGPLCDHSSDAASVGVTHDSLMCQTHSESSDSDVCDDVALGTPMHANFSARKETQPTKYIPQSPINPIKRHGKVVERHGKRRGDDDSLAQCMPRKRHWERAKTLSKLAYRPVSDRAFEHDLDEPLKQGLHLGRRYVQQVRESYARKKSNEARDIYDIPVSDNVDED